MESLSSKNKNANYLLCVIDAFTKYAWGNLWKINNSKTVLNIFIEIVNDQMVNQINYGLIKEKNFTINLYKNG